MNKPRVAKLANAEDLKSSEVTPLEGSTPSSGTNSIHKFKSCREDAGCPVCDICGKYLSEHN